MNSSNDVDGGRCLRKRSCFGCVWQHPLASAPKLFYHTPFYVTLSCARADQIYDRRHTHPDCMLETVVSLFSDVMKTPEVRPRIPFSPCTNKCVDDSRFMEPLFGPPLYTMNHFKLIYWPSSHTSLFSEDHIISLFLHHHALSLSCHLIFQP